MKLRDINILNIKGSDYRFIISGISKTWGQKLETKYWFDQKTRNIIKHKSFFSYIKMGKEILTLGDIEVEKKCYHSKTPIFKKDVDIDKVLVPNRI